MLYNVIKEYDWTSISRGVGLRDKAPTVWLTSYKLESNSLLERAKSYMQLLAISNPDTFYEDLYGKAASQEDIFVLPYFNDNVRSFSNTFGDTFQSGFGGSGGMVSDAVNIAEDTFKRLGADAAIVSNMIGVDNVKNAVSQMAGGNFAEAGKTLVNGFKKGGDPGSYVEAPKYYQYEPNDGPLDVTFVLINTLNDDYMKNHELIKKLTKINRPTRKNSIAMEPPRIYKVKVPGQRFIRWASCSNFSINLLGTKRMINNAIIPEAYQINMSFQSLTVETSNFMDSV